MSFEDKIALRQSYSDELISPDTYDEKTFYDHYNDRNFYGRRFTSEG
jgi:hypothetical protein